MMLIIFFYLKVIFEGTIGRDYQSDIAIDHVELLSTPCSGEIINPSVIGTILSL